eukprot:72683-Chlamydomonas_euryale.AAC.2
MRAARAATARGRGVTVPAPCRRPAAAQASSVAVVGAAAADATEAFGAAAACGAAWRESVRAGERAAQQPEPPPPRLPLILHGPSCGRGLASAARLPCADDRTAAPRPPLIPPPPPPPLPP